MLKALGGLVLLGAAGGGVSALVLWRRGAQDRALSIERAAASESAARRGELRLARKLAAEARELDPTGRAAAVAFVRVSAFDVIDGDLGPAAGVALLSDARNLGMHGIDLAFASLAAAVGVKNDHLVERILAEHSKKTLQIEERYAYAAGAGLDLITSDEAVRHYADADDMAHGELFLAKVRLARSLLFANRIEEARAVVERLPKERRETTVIGSFVERVALLEGGGASKAAPAWVDPSWIPELPRCLRTLAAAMALGDPNAPSGQSAGLDAALDDVDTPCAALWAGRIALAAGDRVSAKAAASCALRMRAELLEAKVFAARLSLVEGDLAGARELAGEGPDKPTVLMIQAIEAYERADKVRLDEIDAESKGSPRRYEMLDAAKALLGEGEIPKAATFDDAIAKNAPWADLLAVDAALATRDVERAKKLALAWSEGPLTDAKKLRKKRIDSPLPDKQPDKQPDKLEPKKK